MSHQMNRASIVNVGGACALLGVCAGLAGAVVGTIYGVGGQEIPLSNSTDFHLLIEKQSALYVREWLFLVYAVFVVGEGLGLYYLTRQVGAMALWAFVVFSAGIIVGIVQDAAVVAFVRQFPTDYARADATTRLALEPFARTVWAIIAVQQAVANTLLGEAGALNSLAVLRTGVASRWFGRFGLVAAAAGVVFAVVTAAAPHLHQFERFAEHLFGLVVLWDLWAAVVMLGFRDGTPVDTRSNDSN
jgi:hypothetical protein